MIKAVEEDLSQEELIASLFTVLDTDTLPRRTEGASFQSYLYELKNSIFIPAIGDDDHVRAMEEAASKGKAAWILDPKQLRAVEESVIEGRPDGKPESEEG